MSFADSARSARNVVRARVLQCREVAPRHFHLQLYAPILAREAAPGQFVHVVTRPNPATWNFDPFLRRAFSIMNTDRESETIAMLFRVEGRGTTALSSAKEGDELDIIGPLGQAFDVSPFHVKQSSNDVSPRAILVGGGVGVPPLVFLGKILCAAEIGVNALTGARAKEDVLCQDTFQKMGIAGAVATDDGSAGHHGRVTDLLQMELENDGNAIVYACGPWPMLRAVALLCQNQGVKCQVSLEEAMPCGIGVCNGCVVRATQPHAGSEKLQLNELVGDEWSPHQSYRRICVEGPACWANEIEWEQL